MFSLDRCYRFSVYLNSHTFTCLRVIESMNILMFGLDLNPPWIEGTRNNVRELSLNLMRDGHIIHCITQGSADQSSDDKIDGVIYHRVRVGAYKAYSEKAACFLLKAPLKIREIVRKYDIDIIHAHSSYAIFGAIVGLGALGQSVGKLLSLDSSGRVWKGVELYSLLRRFGLKISKSDTIIKLSSRMLDAIIVPSLNLRKSLINLGVPPEKVKFIPPSVDISKFNSSVKSNEVKAELGIDVSDKVVLFAGDLSPWKGAEIFLKAIRDVKKTVRNFKSILLTKGIYEFEERRRKEILGLIEELGLNGNVIILGRRNDIPSVYAASNIVVLPYVGDFALMDIPRSLLEALASGKPIVASEIGGITEVIGREIGLLVSAGKVEGLTEAITTLLLDEKLVRQKGLNGRRLIERYYNWDVNIRRIYEVYREYAK